MQFVKSFFQALFTPFKLLFTAPGKLIATPKKLLAMSLPAQVAILVGIFLVICVVAAYLAPFWQGVGYQPAWFRKLPWVLLLVLVIPAVTYQTLKMWLERETSAFPDIDRAWQLGMAELARQGIDLTRAPLFLVLGSASESQEKALFHASRINFKVSQHPQGASPLHWYANDDGIYLVASGVGCLSRLSSLGDGLAVEDKLERVQQQPRAAKRPFNPGQTIPLDDDSDLRRSLTATQSPPEPSVPSANLRGTMEVRNTLDASESPTRTTGGGVSPSASLKLPHDEWVQQPRRLAYLCKLIRRARQPLCPINGLLSLLPYNVIQRGPLEGTEVQKSVMSDRTSIDSCFMLHYPVVALVVGLEVESGFNELVRRVGPERAKENRFGKGMSNVWSTPTGEQLGALCTNACAAFEDWVYTLFKERDALSSPGNAKLFLLLCKIRRLQSRLDSILVDGYSADQESKSPPERPLFAGCYFAATGDSADRQAFVKSVFDRLPEHQEDVEWADGALRENQRFRRWSGVVFGVAAVLLVALGLVVYLMSQSTNAA